jgi:hypothetical protein
MKKYFLLLILSVTIFFFHASVTKHAIYGDGNGYYSYTNSLYFQGNLNFDPIYNYLGNFPGTKFMFSRIFWDTTYAKNGVIRQNPYLTGTGIVWLPSMVLISAINRLFNLNANRFDLIYELGPGITGIFLVTLGLYFLEKYLLFFFSKRTVFWSILITFFATNVIYYTAFEPALSHQPSFFIVSFLLFWTYKFKPNIRNAFILGALMGLLLIVRIADTIVLLPILFQVLRNRPNVKLSPFFLTGILVAVSPQLLTQFLMFGNFLTHPYFTGQSGTWQFSLFNLFEHLFSPLRGLFLWSPVFLIGLWGLVKSKSKIFLLALVALWVVSSSWSGSLSAGYGQRYSFCAIPLLTFGLAYLINEWDIKKTFLVFFVFSFINLNLLTTFYLHKDKLLEPKSVTLEEFMSLQIENPVQIFSYLKSFTKR